MPHVRVPLAIALGLLMALPRQVCVCHAHGDSVRVDGAAPRDCCHHCHDDAWPEDDVDCHPCICQTADRDALPPTVATALPATDLLASVPMLDAPRDAFTASQAMIAEPDPGPPRLYLSLCHFRN